MWRPGSSPFHLCLISCLYRNLLPWCIKNSPSAGSQRRFALNYHLATFSPNDPFFITLGISFHYLRYKCLPSQMQVSAVSNTSVCHLRYKRLSGWPLVFVNYPLIASVKHEKIPNPGPSSPAIAIHSSDAESGVKRMCSPSQILFCTQNKVKKHKIAFVSCKMLIYNNIWRIMLRHQRKM